MLHFNITDQYATVSVIVLGRWTFYCGADKLKAQNVNMDDGWEGILTAGINSSTGSPDNTTAASGRTTNLHSPLAKRSTGCM